MGTNFAWYLVTLFLCAVPVFCAPVSEDPPPGLYNQTSDVGITVLTSSNFNSSLFTFKDDSGEACTEDVIWFVQFYNAWCGHCQHFAPSWKSVANKTLAWSKHLRMAVIDCSTRENAGVCNHYEIMSFPTMMFFPPKSKAYVIGTNYVGAHTESGVYHGMLDYVDKIGFPKESVALPPGTLEDLWRGFGMKERGVENLAVIVEDSDSEIGKDVILSLVGEIRTLAVRRVTTVNNVLISALDGGVNPKGLWFVQKDGTMTKLGRHSLKQ